MECSGVASLSYVSGWGYEIISHYDLISAPVRNVLCWDLEYLDAALASLSLKPPDSEISLPLLATSTADLLKDGLPLNALGIRSLDKLDSLVRLAAWTIVVETVRGEEQTTPS